jgi:hypothetical protein
VREHAQEGDVTVRDPGQVPVELVLEVEPAEVAELEQQSRSVTVEAAVGRSMGIASGPGRFVERGKP